MVQLTMIALPYGILFLVSLILFNYWLSLAVGLLGVFLIIALCVKIDKIDHEKIDITWTTKKFVVLENQIKELKEKDLKSK